MASRSERLESSPFTERPTHRAGEEGSVTTTQGEKKAMQITPRSVCGIVAFVVADIVGIIFVVLGATNIFGAVGSIGFYSSVVVGGWVTVITTGSLIWIAARIYKIRENSPADPQKSRIKPYAERIVLDFENLGQAATNFAIQKLAEHPHIVPTHLGFGRVKPSQIYQPVNQEIPLYITLYNLCFDKFQQAVNKHKEDPWSQDEVIQAADELMKISYTISVLTLKDLPAFTAKLAEKKITRTYAQALQARDSSLVRTFLLCPTVYRGLRFKIGHNDKDENPFTYSKETITETDYQPFYQEKTIQASWRLLYNRFCELVGETVNESELYEADEDLVHSTRKDESAESFSIEPCPPPNGIT